MHCIISTVVVQVVAFEIKYLILSYLILQTDGRTDRQTDEIAISIVAPASPGSL